MNPRTHEHPNARTALLGEGLQAEKVTAIVKTGDGAPAAATARPAVSVVQWTLLTGLLIALYAPVMSALAALWRAEAGYSHGALIPLIAAYMVWQNRRDLRELPWGVCPGAWPILVGGFLLLGLGRLAFVIHAAAASLIVVLGAVVTMVGGWALLRALLFPLVYLGFMVPLPWNIYFGVGDPLQTTTAYLATELVGPVGIPLLREGTLIYLPTVTLEVETACSGVRTALSLLPLAAAFAYLMVGGRWARVLLVASALPIAFLVNIVRVAAIIVQAYVWPEWTSGYALHLYSSSIPMLLGLPMLFGLGGVLQWREGKARSGSPS